MLYYQLTSVFVHFSRVNILEYLDEDGNGFARRQTRILYELSAYIREHRIRFRTQSRCKYKNKIPQNTR